MSIVAVPTGSNCSTAGFTAAAAESVRLSPTPSTLDDDSMTSHPDDEPSTDSPTAAPVLAPVSSPMVKASVAPQISIHVLSPSDIGVDAAAAATHGRAKFVTSRSMTLARARAHAQDRASGIGLGGTTMLAGLQASTVGHGGQLGAAIPASRQHSNPSPMRSRGDSCGSACELDSPVVRNHDLSLASIG
jgi:hypothetical protein